LRYYGYRNLIATASPSQHDHLKKLGASKIFNYRSAGVVKEIRDTYPNIPHIIDCIGSKVGSLEPISKIASRGARVAVMLPVVIKAATKDEAPEYGLEVEPYANWAEGVKLLGVRTHFYLEVSLRKRYRMYDISH
jgi:hypothetical protein